MTRYPEAMENTMFEGASITGIDLSAILVRDAAAEVGFYRDVLGIAPTAIDDGGRGAEFTLADGTTFGVWNQGEGPESDGKVTFFAVGDAGAAVEAIRRRGGTVGELIESPVCRMAFGADPDENGFVIHQRTVRGNDDADNHASADHASIVGLDIASVFVSDPARSIAFYRDVLGLTPTEVDVEGRGAEFTLADGPTFGVWRPDFAEGRQPGSSGMFAVPDAYAAVARMRERGAMLSDPIETPVCFMAFGNDPEGHAFMIHQRKTAAGAARSA
jgi:predicted enzyme related to lactoylglutathione lyase